MIGEIQLVQYIDESAYKNICEKLSEYETDSHPHSHTFTLNEKGIKRFELFETNLKNKIHTYIVQSVLDYQKFDCKYNEFPILLYQRYYELFGDEIMSDFPDYENIACDYMELFGTAEVRNVDTLFKKLLEKNCKPEQLDRSRWNEVEPTYSKVKFCMAKEDKKNVSYLMCIHGRMLKSRVKEKGLHLYNGVLPSVLINENMVYDITAWQLHIYGLDKNLYKPSDITIDLAGDNLQAVNEFISLAEHRNLKPEIKYNSLNREWKCVFSTVKPNHSILTLDTSRDLLKIKSCLFNIDEYYNEFDNVSENIKNQIINNGWNCGNCHDSCRGGVSAKSLGVADLKCIGGAFTFENLTLSDWRQVIDLTERELEYRK